MARSGFSLAQHSKLDRRIVDATAALNASRMGIYEVLETNGGLISLKELLTNVPFRSTCPAGYPGKPGGLMFSRIVPGPEAPSLILLAQLSKLRILSFLKFVHFHSLK
ncbi:MAG: hypothetical protein J5I98_34240 [Phaeodactylibacter sp.]|nr:hypothetical protein [Phaeodactylibacter sp.]